MAPKPKKEEGTKRCQPPDVGLESRTPKKKGVNKNVIHANPAFLETLAQSHSGWIFGAIAEIVDNSKDAKASKLDISVETHFSEMDGDKIPFLSLIDDGCGMSHDELVVMLSLGNKKFHEYDRERIGKYGIGFKTGAMKLGSDVMVLTQTAESRSVAFLSQTYSKDKDELDLPIVSYRRNGLVMKLDTDVQTNTTANRYLGIMEKFSPFDQYFIGGKFALFGENGQGTQVYIWNLEKSGLDFSLEWLRSNDGDTNKDDIIIRSKRTRQRFGQLGQKVPLDYSLRAYLEVIFLNPRMKISIQGSVVKSRLVAKSLVKTATVDGDIQGKPVQLILGHCHEEWERLNSGIFLYWHGRLIEAYKRVGGMVQNPEKSRGVIGVADVTDVMRERGRDLVHNTKQAFEECKAYEELEKWLGNEFDSYCNAYSERPRGTCGIPNVPKQPAAKKTLKCPTRCSISTVSVCSRSPEDDSDKDSERPHVAFDIPKVNMGPKPPAAKESSDCARRKSVASTGNVGPKPPVGKKGPKRCAADVGFRKRFTRSSISRVKFVD